MARSSLSFTIGILLAAGLLAGLGEVFLRCFPPRDLHVYLGEQSPLTGCYRPHPQFGLTYRSWEDFAAENQKRLQPFFGPEAAADPRPIWAFFGNSFVQAHGMLGDQARTHVPEHRIFYLGRNEHPMLRMAQIELLLEHGLRPERIFFALLPVDMVLLGQQPLDTIYVTRKGALTYRPCLPDGPCGVLVRQSQLAWTAWVRTGQHHGNPRYDQRRIFWGLPAELRRDLEHSLSHLARITRDQQVPVTLLLIPSYEQIMGTAPCQFQDDLIALAQPLGYDIVDTRSALCQYHDKPALFIPDKHFTLAGNQILLTDLRNHLRRLPSAVRPGGNPL